MGLFSFSGLNPFSALSSVVSTIGDLTGGSAQNAQANINNDQEAFDTYMASNGIQMKVADAKKAGINPLYALGASEPSAGNFVSGAPSLGDQIAQNLSNLDGQTRAGNAGDPNEQLAVRNMRLQGEVLKSEAAKNYAEAAAADPNTPKPMYEPYYDQSSGQVVMRQSRPYSESTFGTGGMIYSAADFGKRVMNDVFGRQVAPYVEQFLFGDR